MLESQLQAQTTKIIA